MAILDWTNLANTYINYQGEHSNYGDHAKIRQHVKNHLKDIPGQNFEEMTDDDDLYYLFSIHDVNRDGYLDGNELREAFIDEEFGNSEGLKLEEIVEMIDHVLLEDDMNNDGKISWEEYLLSQSYHQV
ncbi:multiple coagulation factor deficiency protein 2-like [Rhizophagus clarus]|uniref:Multiple coagulation factor deficiency protein 2-like n=1 Tax=Rhizophagus clarus TaxID=94130 RepID=A0A8H3LXR2_9GLOM|nr:multiple coagulation factor deficiency protein 2-like [Rhizophagus clarus]